MSYFKWLGLIFIFSSSLALAREGRVCVAPLGSLSSPPGEDSDLFKGVKTEEQEGHNLFPEGHFSSVQIDQQAPIKIHLQQYRCIQHLNLSQKHLLKIKDQKNKAVKPFFFSFKDKGSCLKLWLNPFYASWRLDSLKASHALCR